MAKVEKESYQTRTVDPDDHPEKAPIQDNTSTCSQESDPSVATSHDQHLINVAAAQDLKYGMPDAYANRGEVPAPHATVPYSAPPIVPSTAEPDAPVWKQRRIVDAYLLGIGLGFLGAHHFYLRRYRWGAAYFLTFGFLGCGYIMDLFRMPFLVRRYNETRAKGKIDNTKHLDEAYVCWFPLGLFGAHHFYLGRPGWAVLYLFTVGLFGIGWLIDGFYMPCLVKKVNKQQKRKQTVLVDEGKSLYMAWVFAVFPLSGFIGVHHYYLGNYIFGLFYTLTVGNLGVGYIVDLFRTPILVKRATKVFHTSLLGSHSKAYLDEAYLLAFPLGFLGLHHFYLRRYGWGVLYFFTVGCLGIGWLLDLVRMPCLVRDYNKTVEEQEGSNLPNGTNEGVSNPVMFNDPVSEQEKALEGARADAAYGAMGGPGVFTTNLQPNYPYPQQAGPYGYPEQVPPHAYMPPGPGFYPQNAHLAEAGMPYQPPGVILPQYGDQDGLPSYNDAISTGTLDSSLVSSQGGPPSIPPKV